eukprot:8534221-Pyramimonas_sp.AAC.1
MRPLSNMIVEGHIDQRLYSLPQRIWQLTPVSLRQRVREGLERGGRAEELQRERVVMLHRRRKKLADCPRSHSMLT